MKAGGLAQVAMASIARRQVVAGGIGLVVLSLALRLYNLGGRNTWYDEIGSILFAEKDPGTIVQATAADTMPPLYYFLLHYWLLLGNNLWVARSLSVILSLGVMVLAFAIARQLFGPRVALIALLLVAVNPFQVYYGQEARMYSLLGLSQLLAVYFFLQCLSKGGKGNWTGFVLSQSAAMYTHNAGFLSLLTVDAIALGLVLGRAWLGCPHPNPLPLWRERGQDGPRLRGQDASCAGTEPTPSPFGKGEGRGEGSHDSHSRLGPGNSLKQGPEDGPHPNPLPLQWERGQDGLCAEREPTPSPFGKGERAPSGRGEGSHVDSPGLEASADTMLAYSTWSLSTEPRWGEGGRFLRRLILANVVIGVMFLPWLAFLPGQIAKVTRAFWTETPGIAEAIRTIMVFTFNLPAPAPWAVPVVLAVSLLLFVLLVYHLVIALRHGEDRPAVVLAAALFMGPIAFALLVSFVRPIFVERVLITSSVLYLVLLAWMSERLRPRLVAAFVLVPLAALTAWSLVSYYQYDAFPRVAFPKVMAYLEESLAPGDVILHDNKLTFFPGYYLKRGLPQRFLADPQWSINDTLAGQTQEALGLRYSTLEETTAGKQRVWFVVFSRALDEAVQQGRVQENKDWLDRRFRLEAEVRFNDLSIYRYGVDVN